MDTTRTLLPEFKHDPTSRQDRLSEAWRNFQRGAASKEDADLILADLAKETGYFNTLPMDATPAQLMRREGAREVMGRILFLLDMPFSYMTELRRASSDEQQLDLLRGEA